MNNLILAKRTLMEETNKNTDPKNLSTQQAI